MESPYETAVELLSMGMGLVGACFALYHAWYFWRRRTNLAKAYSLNLFGEFLCNAGVLVFAALDWADCLPSISVWVRAMVRIVIFSAALGATLHLSYRIHQIEEGRGP